jgi:sugar lactone lactonase YvrE
MKTHQKNTRWPLSRAHFTLPITNAVASCVGAVFLLSCTAQAQNLFVNCDGTNIIEITPDGVQSTFASGLIQATGMAFDSAGDLFVGDIQAVDGNGVIYEYTPAGVRSTFASGLAEPTGLAFDSAGNLFVANGQGYNILEFTNGVATEQGIFASGLPFPNGGLAFDSAGNLFATVENVGNTIGYIYEFTTNGTQSSFASGLGYPNSLAFNSAGDLFVSDDHTPNIFEYSTNGTQSTFASGLPGPSGLAFDHAGNLFVGSAIGDNIYEFTTDGTQSTFATLPYYPEYLAFSPKPSFSVSIKMFAGIILNNGNIGSNYLIQATANLSSSNWITLTNVTLPTNPYIYIDYSSPTNSQQFYRAVLQ